MESADREKQLREIVRRLRANEISENYAYSRIVAITATEPGAAEQALSDLKREAVKAQRALAYIVGVAEEGYRGHSTIDLDPGEWSDLQSALSTLHDKLSSDVFPESPSGDVSTHAAGEGGGSGWRDISLYDGCHAVLVSRPTGREVYAPTTAFMDATGVWRVYRSEGGMAPLPFAPSHWIPLPSPPNPSARGEL